jgi:hypothetical protein
MRAILLFPFALAACGESAPDSRGPATVATNKAAPIAAGSLYRCDDGSTVRVRFDRGGGGAEVTVGEAAPVMLAERFDEMGLVYTDGTTELRMAGADVTVGPRDGAARTCRIGA